MLLKKNILAGKNKVFLLFFFIIWFFVFVNNSISKDNLDGIYIGPADLSLAVGEEPGFDRPENSIAYKEILRILEAAKKRNLLAGIHNGSVEYAQKMISKGFNLVTVGADQRFMSSGAKAAIEKIKGTKKKEDSKGY